MGTSKSFGELAQKFERAAVAMQGNPKTIRYAAEEAKKRMDGEIRRVVPDFDMSGLSSQRTKGGKAKSGKVGTRIARGDKNGRSVAVVAVGAVHWLEGGTRAHLVGAGRVNASRTTRSRYRKAQAKFMKAAGAEHPVRGPLWHPGTKPRHVWTKAIKAALPAVEDAFESTTERALREIF